MGQSNSTRSLKTFGTVRSPAIDRSSLSAADLGTVGSHINPQEFDVAKGLFQTKRGMSEASIEAYATLLVESAKQQDLNIFDVIDIDSNGKIGFGEQGISLINALRPTGSKIGFRTSVSDSISLYTSRNILP